MLRRMRGNRQNFLRIPLDTTSLVVSKDAAAEGGHRSTWTVPPHPTPPPVPSPTGPARPLPGGRSPSCSPASGRAPDSGSCGPTSPRRCVGAYNNLGVIGAGHCPVPGLGRAGGDSIAKKAIGGGGGGNWRGMKNQGSSLPMCCNRGGAERAAASRGSDPPSCPRCCPGLLRSCCWSDPLS